MLDRYLSCFIGDYVAAIWQYVLPVLVDNKKWWETWDTLESLYEELSQGRAQLWISGPTNDPSIFYPDRDVIDAVLITEVKKYPSGLQELHMRYMFGSGMLDSVRELMSRMEQYALFMGCDVLTSNSRPGVAKMLKADFGFTSNRVLMTKTLRQGMHS